MTRQGQDKQEHIRMATAALRAVFRAIWGTNSSLETKEAREEAIREIQRMGKSASELDEVLNGGQCYTKPIDNVHDALKAITKDLAQ